jgi:hypothetical protein
MRTPALVLLLCIVSVEGHGAIASPRCRNSIDAFASPPMTGVDVCINASGEWSCLPERTICALVQSRMLRVSGSTQIDIWVKGFKPALTDSTSGKPDFRSANRNATPGSKYDIYRWNPYVVCMYMCGMHRQLTFHSDGVH